VIRRAWGYLVVVLLWIFVQALKRSARRVHLGAPGHGRRESEVAYHQCFVGGPHKKWFVGVTCGEKMPAIPLVPGLFQTEAVVAAEVDRLNLLTRGYL
jgi:hypothetical protein